MLLTLVGCGLRCPLLDTAVLFVLLLSEGGVYYFLRYMNTSELENYLCIEQGLKLGAVVSKNLVVGLVEMTIFKLACCNISGSYR